MKLYYTGDPYIFTQPEFNVKPWNIDLSGIRGFYAYPENVRKGLRVDLIVTDDKYTNRIDKEKEL